MKKNIKLYNVMFPLWFLLIFPITWLVVLPVNFIVDSIVILITLKLIKNNEIFKTYKKSILIVWLLGFVSDFIGAAVLFAAQSVKGDVWYEYIASPVSYNPFDNIYSFMYVLTAIAISGLFIYFFNLKFSFKKTGLSQQHKRIISIVLAVFTAPYALFYPSGLMYNSSNVKFFTNHIIPNRQYIAKIKVGLNESLISLPNDVSYKLKDAINTAKRTRQNINIDINKPDYIINFYEDFETAAKTTLPFWVNDRILFNYENKWYYIKSGDTNEIKDILKKAANKEYILEFEIINEDKYPPGEPLKVYEDDKYIYYLNDASDYFVYFENGDKIDIFKALQSGIVTIDQLENKGLVLVKEEKK